jgi:osmotically inducible protein OsmC
VVGGLPHGSGRFTLGSGAIPEQPVTWASRTERSDGKTSPEELIAAAHGSCFAMAFSNVLAQGGTFDVDNVRVASVDLDIRGHVPDIDAEGFQNAVDQAEQGCPVSNALRGNVEIRVNAALEG